MSSKPASLSHGRPGSRLARALLPWLLAPVVMAPGPAAGLAAVADVGSCDLSGGAGGLEGQVTLPGGAPQSLARLQLYTADGRFIRDTYSDAAGHYQISGLKGGDYLLSAHPRSGTGYVPEWYDNQAHPAHAAPIAVLEALTRTVNLELTPGSQISGRVTAADGGALSAATIVVHDNRGEQVAVGYSNDSGDYVTSPGLRSGQYSVRFNAPSNRPYLAAATSLDAAAPQPVTGVNAILARSAQITGQVTHAETGLPAPAWVSVYGQDVSQTLETDANGHYTTTAGLAPGLYQVAFDQLNESQNLFGTTHAVTVTTPTTLTLHGVLSPAGQITGRVTAPGGAPLAGAGVYVASQDFSYQRSFSADASGVYTATALPSGAYSVWFRHAGYIPEYYDDQPDWPSRSWVQVNAPALAAGINAELAPGGGLRGTLTAADTGQPLSEVEVEAYAADGAYAGSSNVDASGVYALTGLPSGLYRLRFAPRSYGSACGYQAEWYADQATLDRALPVAVTAPDVTAGVDASLARGSAILGRVLDAQLAEPLKDVSVLVYDLGGEIVAEGRTNFLGNYLTAPALPSGAYQVRFSDGDLGQVDEYYNDRLSRSAADIVTVAAPNDVTGISAALAEGGLILGRVTAAESGLGLPNIEVAVYDAEGEVVGWAWTQGDGRYAVTAGLAPGSYRVGFAPSTGEAPALAAHSAGASFFEPLFAFGRLPPDATIRAQAQAAPAYRPMFYHNKWTLAEADPVPVTGPRETTGIDAALLRGLFLSLIGR
jgi:hypothetical protein